MYNQHDEIDFDEIDFDEINLDKLRKAINAGKV